MMLNKKYIATICVIVSAIIYLCAVVIISNINKTVSRRVISEEDYKILSVLFGMDLPPSVKINNVYVSYGFLQAPVVALYELQISSKDFIKIKESAKAIYLNNRIASGGIDYYPFETELEVEFERENLYMLKDAYEIQTETKNANLNHDENITYSSYMIMDMSSSPTHIMYLKTSPIIVNKYN